MKWFSNKQTIMAAPSSLSAIKNFNNEADLEKEKSVGEIISSLQKGKGTIEKYVCQYQGFWYPPIILQHVIFAQQNFNAQSTDILLASSPKCGTTWLKSLAFAIKNREKSAQTPNPLVSLNAHTLVPFIELLGSHTSLEEVETLPSPRLIATHVPYSSLPESVFTSGCRVVYMCREPKDMFVSLWHFLDKLPYKEVPLISLEEACDLVSQGVSGYRPYWDHVRGYNKAASESAERIMFLKYEDMQSDTLNQVKKLAQFMGYPFSLEEESKGGVEEIMQLCSFENLSNLEVNAKGNLQKGVHNGIYFRKGKVGDSKNYLTSEMVKRLDGITKEKFKGLDIGY